VACRPLRWHVEPNGHCEGTIACTGQMNPFVRRTDCLAPAAWRVHASILVYSIEFVFLHVFSLRDVLKAAHFAQQSLGLGDLVATPTLLIEG